MKVTKLSWAGIMLESGNTTLYIDPLQNVDAIFPFVGPPKFPVVGVPLPQTGAANVLITHIHADHYDEMLLKDTFDDRCFIWAPSPVVQIARKAGIKASVVRAYDSFYIGDFRITPVQAVDWVGEDQLSYVISDGTNTVFHGGDTSWHGHWWSYGERFGPFSAAFLPVNGVVGSLPGQTMISDVGGTMNPMQAVTAARILQAGQLIPIHYGLFDNPPTYTEFPGVESALDMEAAKQWVLIRRLADGDMILL